jgi:RNA polymerase sigma-70 factor, ECF subfamily
MRALVEELRVVDEELMRSFQRGDFAAFEELVRRHKQGLYNFVLRRTRNTQVAEDVVQDAFLRVVQGAREYKHEAKFSTWLYTVARNLCIDFARKSVHRRHASLDQSSGNEEGATLVEKTANSDLGAERKALGQELQSKITAAVEALPEDQREVFVLREVSNLPFKEIAEITGVSENTVKSRMRYALERLQDALSEYAEGDGARL